MCDFDLFSKIHPVTYIAIIFVGFFGIIFEADRDTAYAVQRCWQSLGFAISFVCSLFFNVLWLLVSLFTVTMVMFIAAEWKYSEEMKKTLSKFYVDSKVGVWVHVCTVLLL